MKGHPWPESGIRGRESNSASIDSPERPPIRCMTTGKRMLRWVAMGAAKRGCHVGRMWRPDDARNTGRHLRWWNGCASAGRRVDQCRVRAVRWRRAVVCLGIVHRGRSSGGQQGDATRIRSCTVMQGSSVVLADEGAGFAGGRVLDAGMAGVVSGGTASVEMSRIAPGNWGAFEDLIGSGFFAAADVELPFRRPCRYRVPSMQPSCCCRSAPRVTTPDPNDTADLQVKDQPRCSAGIAGCLPASSKRTINAPKHKPRVQLGAGDGGLRR